MRRQNGRQSAGELTRLERDLAEWRRTHGAPTPIPDNVWERAAALCAVHGVGAVARALRLNHTQLKRKMQSLVPAAEQAVQDRPTFIELLPAAIAGGGIAECALEIESARGARMRVVVKNMPSACLAGILREFAG